MARDTESKARINGVSAQMKTFSFLFGVILGEMLLRHCDNLSQTLQTKTISAAEGQHVGQMVIDTLQTVRTDESFELFWKKVCITAESVDVEEPQLPRQRKVPKRYDDGLAGAEFPCTPKSYYWQLYYEATDNVINCLKDRFNQPGCKVYCKLEELLTKASLGEDFASSIEFVSSFYKDDFQPDLLHTQLLAFSVDFQHTHKAKYDGKVLPTIFDIKRYFQELLPAQRILFSQS